MKAIDVTALVLLIIGGLNWLLVGLFQFDLVAFIFGGMEFGEINVLSAIVYVLVGIAALYEMFAIKGIQRRWHVGVSAA